MAQKSAIEWTESTWNPVTGCTKLSAGCDHCYAERFAERFRGVPGHPYETGFDLTLRPERVEQPKRWRRPRLIFVNSMSDLFHEDVPWDYVGRVFETMETADWHVYQVLTKRSSRMRNFVNRRYTADPVPPHIWLGTSIENASSKGRLRHLRQTNASIRFLSLEPLLGSLGTLDLSNIHWVIAGGESGPGARPVDEEWLRAIRDECRAQTVAFFFKQWGGRTPKAGGNQLDGRQWLEYPPNAHIERLAVPLKVAGAPPDNGEDSEAMIFGPWVREKLGCLEKYLSAYTTILRRQKWVKGYFYIDAFAGSSNLKLRKETEEESETLYLLEPAEYTSEDSGTAEYIKGSPRVALGIRHPFTDYFFIEVDDERIKELEKLKREVVGGKPRIHIRKQNCNEYMTEWLQTMQGKWHTWRGVIFLDPFGMQVPWSTIEMIAKTGAIEILINFPVGMSIQRLLKRNGEFTPTIRTKLDSYFGTDEWFDILYRQNIDIFGEMTTEKVGNSGDKLVKWYRKRLQQVFGFVTTAREVQSTLGRPLYYLIFAEPNEKGAKIAKEVLEQGARRVG